MMDSDTFAETVKAKYPEYKDVDNTTLAQKIVAKYPEYAEKVSFAPAKSGVWNDLTTKDLSGASKLDPFAQAARLGQFANKGNQELAGIIAEQSGKHDAVLANANGGATNVPVPKFLTGGAPGQTIDINSIPGVAVAGTLATASEALVPQNRLGVAGYLVEPAMRGYQALKGAAQAISKPGFVAKLGQAKTKVSAADIQQAIDDPSVFTAPSVAEANAAYGKEMGPLQGAARSLRQQTGKTLLSEADWGEAINRPGRILKGQEFETIPAQRVPVQATPGEAANEAILGSAPKFTEIPEQTVPVKMDPQTALEGVQAINRFMRNKVNTAKLDPEQLGELLNQKGQLISFLEDNGTPGMRAAASVLRKAHVSENLGRIAPVNKSGGTDVLRSMAAAAELATAGSHALSGNIPGAIPYAVDAVSASPKLLGGAIRNYHSITNPAVVGAASVGATRLDALRALREKK